jgi:acetyltransferase-like isoleucine patch superfamily enzyme
LRRLGLQIGKDSFFGKDIFVLDYKKLKIGQNSGINHQVYFDCQGVPITIGDGCLVGFRSCFITGVHKLTTDFKSLRPLTELKPITIEDYVWIGANVTVYPGVTIGRGSVISAGSVVTRDIEKYSLAAGIPAREIRLLEPENL